MGILLIAYIAFCPNQVQTLLNLRLTWNRCDLLRYVWLSQNHRLCILPWQTPQHEAQATVGVHADDNLSGGVQLTLQFDGST